MATRVLGTASFPPIPPQPIINAATATVPSPERVRNPNLVVNKGDEVGDHCRGLRQSCVRSVGGLCRAPGDRPKGPTGRG